MEIVRGLTQPEVLNSVNEAVKVYQDMDKENVEEYSLWKTFKTLNSKEMKKEIGFIMTFLKQLSEEKDQNKSKS